MPRVAKPGFYKTVETFCTCGNKVIIAKSFKVQKAVRCQCGRKFTYHNKTGIMSTEKSGERLRFTTLAEGEKKARVSKKRVQKPATRETPVRKYIRRKKIQAVNNETKSMFEAIMKRLDRLENKDDTPDKLAPIYEVITEDRGNIFALNEQEIIDICKYLHRYSENCPTRIEIKLNKLIDKIHTSVFGVNYFDDGEQ